MEKTKFDIPYELLKKAEPIIQENLDVIELIEHPNTYYAFKSIESEKTRFFFYKDGSKALGNYMSGMQVVQWNPKDENKSSNAFHQGSVDSATSKFSEWIRLIRSIKETPSILDKDFQKFYSDDYYSELKIVDPYADLNPFSRDQQKLILDYLSELKLLLLEQTSFPEKDSRESLITEIIELEEKIDKKTKNQVMRGLSDIFGKLYAFSRTLGDDIYKETKKRLIAKLMDLGINYGPKLIQSVSDLFNNQIT